MSKQPEIPVVAIVASRDGRYLVGQRPLEKRHGGLWEFPGGKLDTGESMAEAAARELDEELGMQLVETGPTLAEFRDAGSAYVISFVAAEVAGEPVPTEHTAVGWFTPMELAALPLAPSDARFVREVLLRG